MSRVGGGDEEEERKKEGRKLALPVVLPQPGSSRTPPVILKPSSTLHPPPCLSGMTSLLGAPLALGPRLAPPQPGALHTVGV